SIKFYNTGIRKYGFPKPTDSLYAFTSSVDNKIVYFPKGLATISDTTASGQFFIKDSTKIAVNLIYQFYNTHNTRVLPHKRGEVLYEYKGKFARPAFFFKSSVLIKD